MKSKNKSVYSGEWSRDMKHGKGKMTWEDGLEFEGQWKNSRPVKGCWRRGGEEEEERQKEVSEVEEEAVRMYGCMRCGKEDLAEFWICQECEDVCLCEECRGADVGREHRSEHKVTRHRKLS
eukprot:TRINITY_DN27442_c0_g1_i1.p2 TRINITY_DN27442_c0_g1~~TRINITY_DN27442_c0_g1_i1.p2  ORF type:complete len:122 (-),score=43.60 TRINITY_DN27442_c0_g1_i1:23-388(-)